MRRTLTLLTVFIAVLALSAPVQSETSSDHLRATSDAQAAIFDSVAPSVVRISTSRPKTVSSPQDPFKQFGIPKEFEPFFDEKWFQVPQQPQQPQPPQPPQQEDSQDSEPQYSMFGLGSGIIVRVDDSGAWILTNNHVLEQAERATIEFQEDMPIEDLNLVVDPESKDRNVLLDPKSDIALIHLTPSDIGDRKLKAANLGDSEKLRVGEVVFTLGAPLGRGWTFSQGIVSGKGRGNVLPQRTENEFRYEGFIQTTAFINLGNSGGPLLDLDGNVVGINVAIQTAGGFSNGFIGIGFAIPVNRVKGVMDALIEHGKVTRGWLGVQIENPDPDDAKYFGLTLHRGVKVKQVFPDTPAEKGGLKENDIILTFNGVEVHDTFHLQELVSLAPIDQDAKLEILRAGKKETLEVPIGLQPDEPSLVMAKAKWNFAELGATLRDLEGDEVQYFKENGGFEGVVIEDIEKNGPLGEKSIPKASLITQIENQKIHSVEDARKVIDDLKAKSGDQKERLVMVNYVTRSGGSTEQFQVVKLRFDTK